MASVLNDLKKYQAIKKRIMKASKLRVIVGAGASMHEGGELTNGALLMIHEYGTADIPERPVLRTTIREQSAALVQSLGDDIKAMVRQPSSNPERAYQKMALRLEGAVKKKFAHNSFTPLAPATIKAKGSTKPLIDTGALRQSIQGRVVDESLVRSLTGNGE